MNYSVSDKVKTVWAAILQQWPHASIDQRDPGQRWSEAIDGIPNEAIWHAIKQFKENTSPHPPTMGQVRAMAKSYIPLSPPRKPLPSGERESAWRATALWFSWRLGNHLAALPLENAPRSLPQGTSWAGSLVQRDDAPRITYEGTLDYKAIAEAAPLPDNRMCETFSESKALHKPCWDELQRAFERAWR